MIHILLVAAAAQGVQAVRLPPVAVPRPVPQTTPAPILANPPAGTAEAVSRPDLAARLVPDLVVKSIRVDGSTVYALVANEGSGPAKAFTVDADVYVGPRHGQTMMRGLVSGLAVGESKWAEVSGFFAAGEAAYPPPPPFDLAKATAVRANADPAPMSTSGWGTGYTSLPGEKQETKCTAAAGCIKELREDNNMLKVEGDAIVHGKPE